MNGESHNWQQTLLRIKIIPAMMIGRDSRQLSPIAEVEILRFFDEGFVSGEIMSPVKFESKFFFRQIIVMRFTCPTSDAVIKHHHAVGCKMSMHDWRFAAWSAAVKEWTQTHRGPASYCTDCAKEGRWDETALGVKQWRAECVKKYRLVGATARVARHCFTPNRVSSHLTSFCTHQTHRNPSKWRPTVWINNSPPHSFILWWKFFTKFLQIFRMLCVTVCLNRNARKLRNS